MAKNLVIVESPTKAKTLERYLGSDFSVKASYGHIRDLPKNKMAVDTEHGFEPEYVVSDEKKKVVSTLKAAAKKADQVWLATDFDREGEAIAFHVAELLGVDLATAKRVTFTEITKSAVREAFDHPRAIDLDLVNAQQARRILDRLVGYNVSPLLWKKIRPGLSAGRVQSPALRLIVDREREIQAFTPVEYWSVDARLSPDGDDAAFPARLVQAGDEKISSAPGKPKGSTLLGDEAAATAAADVLRRASYRVAEVKRKEAKRRPSPPFTTSTLQQEASRKLGFTARKTMRVAQQLYEGVSLPGEGQVGLITYMRTDSFTIAAEALREISEVVRREYGDRYALDEPRRYTTKTRGAQEAHEAIRPTSAARLPDAVAPHLDRDQGRLYRLIWQRTVASQMAEAIFDQVAVDIEAAADGAPAHLLRATGQTMRFDGFRRVYFEGRDDAPDEDAESRLPELTDEQVLRLLEVLPEQHFTTPPPRYTEASLVKKLEELGIGRPSTYASIISTLVDREYVRLDEKRFFPEDVGEVKNDFLAEHVPDVVDYTFTARIEEELDDIAEGKMAWTTVVDELWTPLQRAVEKTDEAAERPQEELDETCPRCQEEGRTPPPNLVVKLGRRGKFVACPNYPECTYTRDVSGQERPEPELLDETCPECGKQLMKRVGRYGPFVGCSGYPECRYIKREEQKTGVTCPKCGQGELVVKRARRRGSVFYGCNRYPDCDFTVGTKPLPDACPQCGGLVTESPKGAKCTACGFQPEGAPAEAG
ncbi:MAG: type I DNA topoisomerase [Actinomycetota bacterium]|nr:type I DNA topoisomerase [Actinomycetota bacterium]